MSPKQALEMAIAQCDHINGTPMVAVDDLAPVSEALENLERLARDVMRFAVHPTSCATFAAFLDVPEAPGFKVLGTGPCNCGLEAIMNELNELFGTNVEAKIPEA